MSEVRIVAEPRTEFGKGGARRTRRAGKVPAVVYGHGRDPIHIALPGHELMLALKTPNVLLRVELNGNQQLTLPKAVQRDPIKGFLEHVDLVIVRRGEKVRVEIPVLVTGDPAPDTLLHQELMTVSVQAEATSIPTGVQVSIDGLETGGRVVAGDLRLPTGTTLVTDPEALVVGILAAPTAAQVEAELAEAEAEAGIEHEAPAEEAAVGEPAAAPAPAPAPASPGASPAASPGGEGSGSR